LEVESDPNDHESLPFVLIAALVSIPSGPGRRLLLIFPIFFRKLTPVDLEELVANLDDLTVPATVRAQNRGS
jgi:hypothetical protein